VFATHGAHGTLEGANQAPFFLEGRGHGLSAGLLLLNGRRWTQGQNGVKRQRFHHHPGKSVEIFHSAFDVPFSKSQGLNFFVAWKITMH
jgi:hypothetical protein